MDYGELKKRVIEIRELLKKADATLVPGEGLERALAEAEAVADGIKSVRQGTEQSYIDTARAITSIWSFSETLRPCVAYGLDLDEHLRTVTTGSLDYGSPRQSGTNHIFKDFELELLIAARCLSGGLDVSLNPIKNDPSGDLFVETLRVEVKHPDSVKQLESLLRKFNTALYKDGMYGVIAVGLEDIFQVNPTEVFATDADWKSWFDSQAQEVEGYGAIFMRMAARMTRIIATVQTWTVWYQAAGEISLYRQGNATLLNDRTGVPPQNYKDAARVAAIFNPQYQRWTDIKFKMPGAISNKQREILRSALREQAYQIYDDEGCRHGHALRHWLQAKDDLGVPKDFII
tara:strand:- start:7789 stop:8826 length:1038 start_codon:yes stop_codon:yes gene_type:complete